MKLLGINCEECLYGVFLGEIILCHAPNNILKKCKKYRCFNFTPEMSYMFGKIPS